MDHVEAAGPLAPRRIREVGYAALEVPDLERSKDFYTRVVGLKVAAEMPDALYLRARYEHHALVLHPAPKGSPARLRHLAYETRDDGQTEELRAWLAASGVPVREAPEQPGRLGLAFQFQDIEGNWSEVYRSMERLGGTASMGKAPLRLGHFALGCRGVAPLTQFYRKVGLRVSDFHPVYFAWLRASSEHHGLALFHTGQTRYLHLALDVGSWEGIRLQLDWMMEQDWAAQAGPMRHFEGNNLSVYVPDPDGLRVEFYTDMERIEDDEDHFRREQPRFFNRWLREGRPPQFLDQQLRDGHGKVSEGQ